jgi:hypothetical protein
MSTGLDHIILGIDDLDRGIAWVDGRTGVRAAFGGVHPGRGTRNALLALGPQCYLEIIAPDPQQSSPAWFTQIASMQEPRLLTWAVHTTDLAALAQDAGAAGVLIDGPHDGARSRPDGTRLSWKLFHLRENFGGLLPFFIEWGRDTIHPAADAPGGCSLESFQLQSPDAKELNRACRAWGIDYPVATAQAPRLLARIASPRGNVELTS